MNFAIEQPDESLAVMSRAQVARALNISLDNLDRMHERGEGPPRFKVSPRRWGYPVRDFKKWQSRRLADAA